MKYVVREGTERGAGMYWNGSHMTATAAHANRFDVASDAESCRKALEAYWPMTAFRVVRLLSPTESRAKAEERGRVAGIHQAIAVVHQQAPRYRAAALEALLCPCQGALEDPGEHVAACPWADPNYPKGQVF